jgi:acyl carrier protein
MDKKQISNILKDVLKKNEVNESFEKIMKSNSLASAGVDSLKAMEIVLAMEEKLGCRIPDEKLNGIKDFNDLIDILASLSK